MTADASGNSNNGTVDGATHGAGKFGKGYGFVTDDFIEVADSASLDITGDITIVMWVKPNAHSADEWPFSKIASPHTAGYGIVLAATSLEVWPHFGIDGALQNPKSNNGLASGTWAHIAVTHDGTDIKIYIDAALDRTFNAPGTIGANNNVLRMGSTSSGSQFFNGSIDEVSVWNRALPEHEIRQVMLGFYQGGM